MSYVGNNHPELKRLPDRESEMAQLSADLRTICRLHELSTRLLATTELQPLLEEILDATIELLDADFGNIQLYNPQSDALYIVAQRGFKQDFLDHFNNVHELSAACGRALRHGGRVIIHDVNTDPAFAPHRKIAASAGFRAVQSTPLFSRGGEPLGMISTHFREPHTPSEHELRFLDLYARYAAEFIERQRTSQALRASENRFRRYFDLGLIGMAITSPTRIFLEVNDELCRILGCERGELLQKNWEEITHPDDIAADRAQFSRVMRGEINGYTLDKRWIRKDGQIVYSIMSANCGRRPDGSVEYFVGLVQDITRRKRVEEKLREYEKVVEGLDEQIAVVGRDYRYLLANYAFLSYRGLKREQLVGRFVPEVLNPEAWNKAIKPRLDQALQGKVVKYELTYDYPQRGKRDMSVSYFPIEGPNGIDRIACVLRDITERKRAEEKLQRSEMYLEEGQRLSHTASWACNVSTGEMYWSAELFRIYGLDPLTTKPTFAAVLNGIHPEDRSRVKNSFAQAVREQSVYQLAHRIVWSDGTIRHVNNLAHPVFSENGSLIEYVGTTIDTTERVQAEERLHKAHERVEALLESISDNFFGVDKEGRFTYFNKHAAEQMRNLGKDPEALIGKVTWEEFPDMPNIENVKRVLTEGVVVVDELYYEPLGEWVENHMYPSSDGGLVTFQRYITERKRTEEELRKTQAELAHVGRLTTVGELTASIAHEVNQPLGAIVTNGHACLRLLSGEKPDIGEARQAVECMIADGIRASEVLKRIRALLKKSSGGKSSHNINDIIREVLGLIAGELRKNSIHVHTHLARHLPNVLVDRVQIQQVVLNLILNSKEAMTVADWQRRELSIISEQSGHEILVTIADTGVGISPEDMTRAFEPFFTSKEGGLGLGLSISRTIINAHGGKLWTVPRRNGNGTVFRFTLRTVERV